MTSSPPESAIYSEDDDLLGAGVHHFAFWKLVLKTTLVELPSSTPKPLFGYDEVCRDLTFPLALC